jgi:hypothetical protein
VTFIADEGHLSMVRSVMKGVFLLGIFPSSRMAFQARARPEGIAQMGGFPVCAYKIGYSVAGGQGFDEYFISDSGTDVTINALDVFLTFEVVGCGQSNPLALHWMELGKFFLVQMARRAERVVLF